MKRAIRILSVLMGLAVLPIAAWSQDAIEATPESFLEVTGGRTLVQDFADGLVTEIGIPALDATAQDAAKLVVKMSPERTRIKASFRAAVQKRWLPRNFRLEVSGVDCRHVAKVDAFTVKQSVRADGRRAPQASTVVVWVPESEARSWLDWVSAVGARRLRSFTLFLEDGTPLRDVLEIRFASAVVRSESRVEVGGAVLHRFELECGNPALAVSPPTREVAPSGAPATAR